MHGGTDLEPSLALVPTEPELGESEGVPWWYWDPLAWRRRFWKWAQYRVQRAKQERAAATRVDQARGAEGNANAQGEGDPLAQCKALFECGELFRQVESRIGHCDNPSAWNHAGLPLRRAGSDEGATEHRFGGDRAAGPARDASNRIIDSHLRGEEARGGAAPDITYDIVGNPTEIRDWRDPAEWPDGAKPVTRKIAYDDLYRVNQVKYEYSTADETWTSPYAQENGETSTERDHRRSAPSPHVKFDKRVLQQNIDYDWLGNTATTDDDAHGFYDRSLGTLVNDPTKPYQLKSASNTSTGSDRKGSLNATYDVSGNLTDLAVNRSGTCLPSGANCNQRYHYQWDEVGRLVRAQRWDTSGNPAGDPTVDLSYTYDASDNRVLKSATAKENGNNVQRHAVYISGGQELRGAKYDTTYGSGGVADYQLDSTTEIAYLFAHGVRLGRVAYDNGGGMPKYTGYDDGDPKQHVLLNLDDTLGSTALVIDQATGELVESTAYLAYGATESDYRPSRWQGLREDYRFTGKEEDVEVGLQYFGKRFLSPYLGRWVSADPLAVHAPGKADWNLYAYVLGQILRSIDPLGLDSYAQRSATIENPGTDRETQTFATDTIEAERPQVCSGAYNNLDQSTLRAAQANEARQHPSESGPKAERDASYETQQYIQQSRDGLTAIMGGPIGTTGYLDTYAAHRFGGDTIQQSFDRANEVAAGVSNLDDAVLAAGAGRARALEQSRVPSAPEAKSPVPSRATASVAAGEVPKINMGQQGKHIVGHHNYTEGRSILTADPAKLAERAGTGTPANAVTRGQPGFRERVDFGEVIGDFVKDGTATPTTNGIIHYGKGGIHIVPAAPN